MMLISRSLFNIFSTTHTMMGLVLLVLVTCCNIYEVTNQKIHSDGISNVKNRRMQPSVIMMVRNLGPNQTDCNDWDDSNPQDSIASSNFVSDDFGDQIVDAIKWTLDELQPNNDKDGIVSKYRQQIKSTIFLCII